MYSSTHLCCCCYCGCCSCCWCCWCCGGGGGWAGSDKRKRKSPQIMWFVEGGLEWLVKLFSPAHDLWLISSSLDTWHSQLNHNHHHNINASTTTTATMTTTTTTINGKPLIFFSLNFLCFNLLIFCISYHNYRPWWQLTTEKKHHRHTNQLPTYSMCQTGNCNNSSSSSDLRRNTSSWAAGMFILLLLH